MTGNKKPLIDHLKEFTEAVNVAGKLTAKSKKDLAVLLTGKAIVTTEDVETIKAALAASEKLVTVPKQVKPVKVEPVKPVLYYSVMVIEKGEGKPKATSKNFKDEDILVAKTDAEQFYIEHIFKGCLSVDLYIEDENSDLSIDVSGNESIENAKLEANLVRRTTGKRFTPVSWIDRYQKLFDSYAAKQLKLNDEKSESNFTAEMAKNLIERF